jgi:heptaprenyl diphosphate synthase
MLTALYLLGPKEAFAISMVRIVLSGFAFGIGTLPYSLAGGLLSLGLMLLMKKSGRFGMPGVSVAGGVAHNIGQTLVAMALLGAKTVYYFPMLFFSGIIAGILIGLIASVVLKKLQGLKL